MKVKKQGRVKLYKVFLHDRFHQATIQVQINQRYDFKGTALLVLNPR